MIYFVVENSAGRVDRWGSAAARDEVTVHEGESVEYLDAPFVPPPYVPPEKTYVERRYAEYPPITDFADAWVKNDAVALEAYRQQCLAVKAKHPKP